MTIEDIIAAVECGTDLQRAALLKVLQKPATKPNPNPTDEDIRVLLRTLGIPDHLSGSRYLVQAIHLILSDPTYLAYGGYCKLYRDCGEAAGGTGSKAERAIRHAIETSVQRCSVDTLERFFGESINPNKGAPTVSEFLARATHFFSE